MSDQTTSVEISRNGLKASGQQVNVILLTFVLAGVSGLGYGMYTHLHDARDASKAFVSALREQTQAIKESTAAQREQTCIMKFDQRERREHADWCRQVSGAAAVPLR